jgi:hypothetical protein
METLSKSLRAPIVKVSENTQTNCLKISNLWIYLKSWEIQRVNIGFSYDPYISFSPSSQQALLPIPGHLLQGVPILLFHYQRVG